MTIKILDNLIIGDTEWKTSPFKFNVKELNFTSGDTPTPPAGDNRLITSDDKVFITSDGKTFLVNQIVDTDYGKVVESTVPLNDASLHEADGSVLTRTNYANFVDKVAELYEDDPTQTCFAQATGETIYNVTLVGNLTNTDGVISGFPSDRYIDCGTFKPDNNTWEIIVKVQNKDVMFSSSASFFCGEGGSYLRVGYYKQSSEYKLTLYVGDGTSYFINGVTSTNTLSFNTDYYIKASFDGEKYVVSHSTDNENWTTDIEQTSSTTVPQFNLIMGNNPDKITMFGGSIDINGCSIKINNSLVWEGATLIDTAEKDYNHDLMMLDGVCGKYVYDSVNNTVRIPTYKNQIKTSENTTDTYYYIATGA